ncbi:MAG: hypothetical protein QOI78_8678, partial [Actinomycetota bacterium]|nr:hypothetical protein [Actinomycetota bacterium]
MNNAVTGLAVALAVLTLGAGRGS